MDWILYWKMYCWLAGCLLLLLSFSFSFHRITKIGPQKVGPLYSRIPLLIVSGSELTSFTTSMVNISPQFGEVLLRSTFAQQPGSATAALAACNTMQAFQCVGGGERS